MGVDVNNIVLSFYDELDYRCQKIKFNFSSSEEKLKNRDYDLWVNEISGNKNYCKYSGEKLLINSGFFGI